MSSLAPSGTTLLAGTEGGVFRSTDSALIWVAICSGRLAGLTVNSLTVSGRKVLAATADVGIWKYPP